MSERKRPSSVHDAPMHDLNVPHSQPLDATAECRVRVWTEDIADRIPAHQIGLGIAYPPIYHPEDDALFGYDRVFEAGRTS